LGDESNATNQVVVVVNRTFGTRLAETAKRHHTWIVDTPPNRLAAEAVWKQTATYSSGRGATTFDDDPSAAPDELVARMLCTIGEHHPGVNRLEIYGCSLTPALKAELAECGFGSVVNVEDGFLVSRQTEEAG
jgi:hypothetical protein